MPEDQKISELSEITSNVPLDLLIPVMDPNEPLDENKNKSISVGLLSGSTFRVSMALLTVEETSNTATDDPIPFDQIIGDHVLTASGGITIPAGEEALLMGQALLDMPISPGSRLQWYNVTDGEYIGGNLLVLSYPTTATQYIPSQVVARTPAENEDKTYELRLFFSGSVSAIKLYGTQATAISWTASDYENMVSVNISDVDFAAEPGNHYKYDATAQTDNRTMTMPSPSAPVGSKFRVTYEGIHATYGLTTALNGNTVIDKLLGRTLRAGTFHYNGGAQDTSGSSFDFFGGISDFTAAIIAEGEISITMPFTLNGTAGRIPISVSGYSESSANNWSDGYNAAATLGNTVEFEKFRSNGQGSSPPGVGRESTLIVHDPDGINRIVLEYTEIEFEKISPTTWIARLL